MARKDAIGLFWQDQPVVRTAAVKEKRLPPERTWELPTYLPNLAEALAFRSARIISDQELIDFSLEELLHNKGKHKFIFDIEVYPNYFCCSFKSVATGKYIWFEHAPDFDYYLDVDKFKWMIETFTMVGFNSIGYDLPIASLAIDGCSTEDLQLATEMIILQNERPSDVLKQFGVKLLKCDHIDLIEVAPLSGSLKTYSGRLHSRRMQDLPFKPGTVLTRDQAAIVLYYNVNDLNNTGDLLKSLDEQMSLRIALGKEYALDLRSKSDAQIAEAVIGKEVGVLNGTRPTRPTILPGTRCKYRIPDFIKYQTPLMNDLLNVIRNVDFIVKETGGIALPDVLANMEIKIANGVYRMGIGGLHSSETTVCHLASPTTILSDRDVASYYPQIILNQNLFPYHLGPNFLRVYKGIVDKRLAAKKRKDKVVADSLKITVNGSFGKLGSMWSILYSPDLLIQVTITGQLALLMLIETLELAGIPVTSANTDGVTIECPTDRKGDMDAIVKWWEKATNFETEEALYKAVYSRDVNNYIAMYAEPKKNPDGSFTYAKLKGVFSYAGLQKNPTNEICIDAIVNLLALNIPIEKTINECKDIKKFVCVRNVKGGAVKDGNYLGKVIRWYYAVGETGEIVYAMSGNKVPRSEGAKPLMDLPNQLPADINYTWYIEETKKMLSEIGYAQ